MNTELIGVKFVAIFAVVAFSARCSAVGTAPINMDSLAKELAPPKDKALVYIIRTSGSKLIAWTVYCDGIRIGVNGRGRVDED